MGISSNFPNFKGTLTTFKESTYLILEILREFLKNFSISLRKDGLLEKQDEFGTVKCF